MTYQSRGRSMFEVVLVSPLISYLLFVFHFLLWISLSDNTICLYIQLQLARNATTTTSLKTEKNHYLIGDLLCSIPRRLHHSPLYRQLFPSKASTRKTKAETRGKTGGVCISIGSAQRHST